MGAVGPPKPTPVFLAPAGPGGGPLPPPRSGSPEGGGGAGGAAGGGGGGGGAEKVGRGGVYPAVVAAPPEPGADARDELLDGEGLRHVVVGAGLEPADLRADVVERGEDDHRQPRLRG